MTTIDYTHRIPNNVDLADDRKLTRALEQWMPQFETWWHDLGPQGFETADVYLRTAINTNIHRQSAWGTPSSRTTAGGSSSPTRRPTGASPTGSSRASRCGRTSPASSATRCGA